MLTLLQKYWQDTKFNYNIKPNFVIFLMNDINDKNCSQLFFTLAKNSVLTFDRYYINMKLKRSFEQWLLKKLLFWKKMAMIPLQEKLYIFFFYLFIEINFAA